MAKHTLVSPDRKHRRVTESPAVVVRLRSRGWVEDKPKPEKSPEKPKDKAEESKPDAN